MSPLLAVQCPSKKSVVFVVTGSCESDILVCVCVCVYVVCERERERVSACILLLIVGLLCDLLWSDPDKDIQGWGENDRGVSFTFGSDIVTKFLNRHDLDLICRAHQV